VALVFVLVSFFVPFILAPFIFLYQVYSIIYAVILAAVFFFLAQLLTEGVEFLRWEIRNQKNLLFGYKGGLQSRIIAVPKKAVKSS